MLLEESVAPAVALAWVVVFVLSDVVVVLEFSIASLAALLESLPALEESVELGWALLTASFSWDFKDPTKIYISKVSFEKIFKYVNLPLIAFLFVALVLVAFDDVAVVFCLFGLCRSRS